MFSSTFSRHHTLCNKKTNKHTHTHEHIDKTANNVPIINHLSNLYRFSANGTADKIGHANFSSNVNRLNEKPKSRSSLPFDYVMTFHSALRANHYYYLLFEKAERKETIECEAFLAKFAHL